MTALGRFFTWPLRTWNQSLPFRAVVSSLAASVLLWVLTGLFMGQQVSDGLADLVPAADRTATVALVNRSVALSALIFIPVMALAMYLIALQVTRPLRAARATAEALAMGEPGRRMAVEGPEDSAALARAVNRMATELTRRLGELEAMGHQQHQFVSDVSHELRTPLTTVRMAADVIYESRDELSPIAARSAELLSCEVDRFETLLHDLLDLSRIDAGAAYLATEETDIAQLVRDEVSSHAPLSDKYGSRMVVDAEGPCLARVDAMRIRRVVVNLLTNAIEHGEGRPIRVAVRGGVDSVAVVVRDHGVGLTPDEQERVFTRFWRADPSRLRTVGGTGLGLAIALENAELHGGSLTVWGCPGGGAQFRLLLPLAPNEPIMGPPPLPHVPVDAWVAPPRPAPRERGPRPS